MTARTRWLVTIVAVAGVTHVHDVPIGAQPLASFAQQAYLKAPQRDSPDDFGDHVAISGDTIVVGAVNENGSATGVNGVIDEGAPLSGAAYVYVRTGTGWTLQAYLKASNTNAGDRFGSVVAISGDTIVVGAYAEASGASGVNANQADNGAPNAGAAYVFVRNGSTWVQQAYLKASNAQAEDFFGWAVGVSGDTIVVGAWGEDSSARGINGDQGNNSASQAGAAYVFQRAGGVWTQDAYVKASNAATDTEFGNVVAIDGPTMAIAGLSPYVFRRGAAGWVEEQRLTTPVGQFVESCLSISGDTLATCDHLTRPRVFDRLGGAWIEQALPAAAGTDKSDLFGFSVALSGNWLAVGAPGEASNARIVDGDRTNNQAPGSGAAYVFERSGGTWVERAYLKASNADPGDSFGRSVALFGSRVVVGAPSEASQNGAPGNNSAYRAGAAYVFEPGSAGGPIGGGAPAPVALSGSVAGTRVSLQWVPGGGSAPTSYTLQVALDQAFTQLFFNQSVGLTTAVAGDVPETFTGWARVVALNAAGQSTSNVVAIATGGCAGPPPAPANLVASKAGSSASVAWTPVPGATGYRVEADVNGVANVFNAPIGTATSVSGSGLAQAVYAVRVFAGNACGEGPPATVTFTIP